MSDSIEAKLDRLRADEPIPLGAVDFSMNAPERLRNELGRTFNYFGRVEGEVAYDPLMALMPRLGTEYNGYTSHGSDFIRIWVDQEQAHGQIFEELQKHLGLSPSPTNTEVSLHNKIGGILGRLSPSLHGVLELTYLTRGAMHEKLTFIGYERMATKLLAMGETALHETVIKPIRRQESGHLGYYKQAAQELKHHLKPWQIRLARRLSIATYAPVGAGNKSDKPDFGHVAETLVGDNVEMFAAPIHRIAETALTIHTEETLPPFVLKALQECIETARDARAAPSPH